MAAVYRGKIRPEPPAILPHHETQHDVLLNSLLRPVGSSGGGNGKVYLNKSSSSMATRRLARIRATAMLILLFFTVAGSFYLSYRVAMDNMKKVDLEQVILIPEKIQTNEAINAPKTKISSSSQINQDKCAFRSYPSNRLYGLSSKSQPKFLSEAAYIRGQWPIIINPDTNDNKIREDGKTIVQTSPVKVCFDTTSWEDLIDKNGKERLPFTDGHNPSVISLAPNPFSVSNLGNHHVRLDPKYLKPIASALPSMSLRSLFLGVTIFGGGQCKFGLSPKDVDNYRFSMYEEPQGGKRAVIAVLAPPNIKSSDGSPPRKHTPFETLAQTTLLLERDVKYGASRKRAIQPEKVGDGFARMHQEFDDPRLFFHLGRVWILYRNGPLFGYTDQIHNPIHFEEVSSANDASGAKFVAYVKASETVRLGGGRNIALISEEPVEKKKNGEVEWVPSPSLKALTWVDPVTVIDGVDVGDLEERLKNRRLLEVGNANGNTGNHNVSQATNSFHPDSPEWSLYYHHQSQQHRRLGPKPTKSNIHGTNGYMVPLPSTRELLGIAHFHRPENRKSSEFALHGHHYTHAFFTIARKAGDDTDEISSKPFKLRRLSNEFVFRTNSLPAGEMQKPRDGDVIQFASGIDVVGSDIDDGQLIISYGINDCEGSVFTLAMEMVQSMLIVVDPEQEVIDLMEFIRK